MAVTKVQSCSGVVAAAGTSVAATFDAAFQGDSHLVAAISFYATPATPQVSGISQTGVTWVLAKRQIRSSSPYVCTEIWYAENVGAGAGLTATATISASVTHKTMIAVEHTGLALSNSIDQVGSNTVGNLVGATVSIPSGTTPLTIKTNLKSVGFGVYHNKATADTCDTCATDCATLCVTAPCACGTVKGCPTVLDCSTTSA